jgi:glycosyltransferase involved in cell wall biosynthesis
MHEQGWIITCFSVRKNKASWRAIRADIVPSIKVVKRGTPIKLRRLLFGSTTTLRQYLFGRVFAYDIVMVSRYPSMQKVGPVLKWLRATNKNCKFIYDFEALPALGERSRHVLGDGGTRDDAEARVREQIAAVDWVDAVICNSPGDAHELQRLGRTDAISVCYLDSPVVTSAGFSERKDFLFVGRLAEEGSPNVDGLQWFVGEVWPTIVARLGPQVRLLVAGLATAPSIRALQSDSCQLLGVVRDLRTLYDRARVFVAANRVGYGVPLKVIEAAAYGVPVVTTDEINSYLGWRNGFDLLCGDQPSVFADACIRLYEDPGLWNKVRAEAVNRIDPQGDRKRLLDLVNSLAAQPASRLQ